MNRRTVITLVGGAAVWPLVARAQEAAKLRTIGFLGASTASWQRLWTSAFVQRLGERGWIEGQTIKIEYRWAEARRELFAQYLEEFVRLKVDIIVTHPDAAVLVAKQMTSTIPIVFPVANDPIEIGIVASLAKPGGNATGLSLQRRDTIGKRLEILREIVPTLHRLGILYNRNVPSEMEEVHKAAPALGVTLVKQDFEQAKDIAPAFEALAPRIDALYVAVDPLAFFSRVEIANLAVAAGVPTIFAVREYVDAGGLVSYGPNFADLFRRSADFVDKILRGAKAGDIPVEQPTKFDFVINLRTARALGIEMPPTVLVRANEVIE